MRDRRHRARAAALHSPPPHNCHSQGRAQNNHIPPDRAHSTHTITNEGPSAVPMEHGLSGVFEWALAS